MLLVPMELVVPQVSVCLWCPRCLCACGAHGACGTLGVCVPVVPMVLVVPQQTGHVLDHQIKHVHDLGLVPEVGVYIRWIPWPEVGPNQRRALTRGGLLREVGSYERWALK